MKVDVARPDAARVKELTREARELAAKAKEIEDAVYDLKAVNPNKRPAVDMRTPEELMDIIEAKGREITAALARLRERQSGGTSAPIVGVAQPPSRDDTQPKPAARSM